MLKVADKAPNFELPTSNGNKLNLKDFRGKKVVLYFYPKDDTPTCTKEACSFNENLSALERKGAVVLGVSADSQRSHAKFAGKYNLRFPLLSDEGKGVIKAYDVWKKKSMFGKKFMGIVRTTFIIDESGTITHIFSNVRVNRHAEKVIEALG